MKILIKTNSINGYKLSIKKNWIIEFTYHWRLKETKELIIKLIIISK